jgi:hypothetical protein
MGCHHVISGASSPAIGGTAILLRQVYAMVGQKTVAKLAIELHQHRSTWGRLSLKALPARHSMVGGLTYLVMLGLTS